MDSSWSSVIDLADQVGDLSEERALDYTRWTPGVAEWLADPSPYRVLKGGNGTGKTRAHAAELVWRAEGRHPFRRTHRPPVKMVCYGYSFSAMETIMEEVWRFVDKSQVVYGGFDPGRGCRGKPPRITWRNGSVLLFLTYGESTEAYAGKTLHYQGLDEPMPESKWGEVRSRTRGVSGEIGMTFTPTPEAPPQLWLREKCDQGEVSLTNIPLCLDAVTPTGGRPWMTQAEIEALIASWLPLERDMRRGVSWEPITSGRQLDGFEERHITTAVPMVELRGGVGIDHGIVAGRQGAMVVATDGWSIWFLAEYRPDKKGPRTSPRQDAEGIRRALKEVGWDFDTDLIWMGDRAAESQSWGSRKSNGALVSAIEKLMNRRREEIGPSGLWIRVPNKQAISPWHGFSMLNSLFIEDRAYVHPRCVNFIESLRTWEGNPRDPAKDLLDGARYITLRLIEVHDLRPPDIMMR